MMNSVVSINKLDLSSNPEPRSNHGDQASDESDEEADFKLPGTTDLEPDDFKFEANVKEVEEKNIQKKDKTRESRL